MKNKKDSLFSNIPAPALVISAIICYQLGAAIATHLFSSLGPGGTVLFRIGFSAIFLIIAGKGLPKHIDKKMLLWTILYGLSLAGMNFAFYTSFSKIPLGVAATIEFIGPLAIAFLGSKKLEDFIFVLMAAIGIVLFAPWTGGSVDPVGIVFALFAAVCWAFYILLAAKVGKLLPGRSGLTLAMTFGTITMLPIGIIQAGVHLLSPVAIIGGLLVAFLSSTLPYSFEIEALRKIPPHIFGILVSLEPAIATIAGVFLLHQSLTIRDSVALMLVTAASIGVTMHKKTNEEAVIE